MTPSHPGMSSSNGSLAGKHSKSGLEASPPVLSEPIGNPPTDEEEASPTIHRGSRKRPWSATCELCKHKKVKCDRRRPECGQCLRTQQACVYKERKKPGLRAGYSRELERKIHYLESIIRDQDNQISQMTSGPTQLSPSEVHSSPYRLTEVPGSSTTPFMETSPRGASNTLSAAHQSTYSREPHSSCLSQTQSTQQMLSNVRTSTQTIVDPQTGSPVASLSQGGQLSMNSPIREGLPPSEYLHILVNLYFEHINVWAPILSSKAAIHGLCESSNLDDADAVLLHAIVTAALRFDTESRLSADLRAHYYRSSSDVVQLFGLRNSNIRALQALMILALDLTGTLNGPHGYKVLAVISRSIVHLGLATETTSSVPSDGFDSNYAMLRAHVLGEPQSWAEDEERRRLFWMFYVLDRYTTVATAFNFVLDEPEISRRLPCREDLFERNQPVETRWFSPTQRQPPHYPLDRPENLGSFAYHCEVLSILSRIHLFLRKPTNIYSQSDVQRWQKSYRELANVLTSWQMSLPRQYADLPQLLRSDFKLSSIGWVTLHAAFNTTSIRLHSAAAYPAVCSPIFVASYNAIQRCFSAVERVCELGRYAVANNLLNRLGPPFAFSLWVSARLLLVHGSTLDREHDLDPNINFLVSALESMGYYWEVAKRYHRILSRVLEEYEGTKQAVDEHGQQITPDTVKALADIRRAAFDLDLMISHQPHAVITPGLVPTLTTADVENLNLFDFFNFPRVHFEHNYLQGSNINTNAEGTPMFVPYDQISSDFRLPDPDVDWLSADADPMGESETL